MICYHRKMHVSPSPQLNQELLVASVDWWINPTHSHKCNYFICQRLERAHRAPWARRFQQRKERGELLVVSPSFSSPVGSVPCNLIRANHSLIAEVIISSTPFWPVEDIASRIWVSKWIVLPFMHTHVHKLWLCRPLLEKDMYYSTTC